MAYDKNNFDPKAAAEARKKEMEEITTKLEKGVKDIFSSDNFKDYLNFCAKLPKVLCEQSDPYHDAKT